MIKLSFIDISRFFNHFYPLLIIIFLLLFNYISLSTLILSYISYCIYIYFTTKSKLFYIETEFNKKLLNHCPSVKFPSFKQYIYLPFTFFQFVLLKFTLPKTSKKLKCTEEYVNNEGVKIIWIQYESTPTPNDTHSLPVLLVLPGITGKISDPYLRNLIFNALNFNYEVVIYQMRTLSEKMKMPLDEKKFVNFMDDLDEVIKKIKTKNPNKIFCISASYGANFLVRYLGTRNLKTNFIEGGVSISNPCNYIISQIVGQDSIYETIILRFVKRNYIGAINSVNKDRKDFFDAKKLLTTNRLTEFDRGFFTKLLGYKNVDQYYLGESCDKYFKYINKPFLMINSKDDPITSFKGIPIDDVLENEHIIFIETDRGAHMAFVENSFGLNFKPKQWNFKPTFEFINYLRDFGGEN